MNAFDTVIGQERAVRHLRAALATPHHAYLFVGPAGIGKETAAKAFALALNCTRGEGCLDGEGACPECLAIHHGNHPDVRIAVPSEGKKVFSVEDVRKLVQEAAWKAHRGKWKVYIVSTELLNVQGANTLLKTVEEPVPGTVIVLLGPSVDAVLPTLVSRCQIVPFGPVARPLIESELQKRGVEELRATELSALADGRLGWALTESQHEAPEPPRLIALTTMTDRLAEAERLAALDTESQQRAVESLLIQVRDIIIWAETGRDDLVSRSADAAARHRGLPREYWLRALSRLEKHRRQLLSHANAKLAWTVLAGDLAPTARELERSARS